jgi:membrane protein YqaA with SNARE-associated domain
MIPYLSLFVWSFLAATILPLASEPMLIALVRLHDAVVLPVLVATAGNYLGACTTYLLARVAARRLKPVTKATATHARAVRMVERFGQPALLLSWVPIVGDAIVVVAGAVGMPFAPFSAWTLAGKLARYAAVAWIAAQL